MEKKLEDLEDVTEKEKGKNFSFYVNSERLGKNFEAHFSLSREFLENIGSQIKDAYKAKIWKIILLDDGSDNNLNAGYAMLTIYPRSIEKFPVSAIVEMEGDGPEDFDEDENNMTKIERYSCPVRINENFEVIPYSLEELKPFRGQ